MKSVQSNCHQVHTFERYQSFLSTTDLKNRIILFTGTWNSDFAHPFKFSYSGEGLHEKVLSRFTKWLQMHSPQLNVKFLEKQLRLVSNLATSYWPKAKRKAWDVLYKTLQENNDFILAIIGTDKNLSAQLINLNKLLHGKLKAT